MTAAQTIGFIGLGAMASRMAVNLGKAGYKTVAYTPSGKGEMAIHPFSPRQPKSPAPRISFWYACPMMKPLKPVCMVSRAHSRA